MKFDTIEDRNRFVEENRRLLLRFARRFHKRRRCYRLSISDLVQAAAVELIECHENIDVSRSFSTYVWSRTYRAMTLLWKNTEFAIAVKRGRPEARYAALRQQWERAFRSRRGISLMHDTLASVNGDARSRDTVFDVRSAISLLSPRESEVVTRYYGGETLVEIGASLGVSDERVRQIRVAAEDKLRVSLAAYREAS